MTVYIRGKNDFMCEPNALTLYVHYSFYIHDESRAAAEAATEKRRRKKKHTT